MFKVKKKLYLIIEDDLSHESSDHIEEKKQAIKEGVLTCLNLLRPTIRENQQITPTVEPKKKIIITKKYYNILDNDSDDTDKENQSNTPVLDENPTRRKTARGSNSSKRAGSSKQQENESPSKRKKTTDDIDSPLPIISPNVVKKITPTRTKPDELGEEKKSKSLRLARKVQQTKEPRSTETSSHLTKKSSVDLRNDKGETLIHQAVKKGDLQRVKQLIDEGHSVNTIDHNSWTPLHEVILLNNTLYL